MPKRYLVVMKGVDGRIETYPMKEWLRKNPAQLPKGYDASESTSHQLRRALRRQGWDIEELSDRVMLVKPDEQGDTAYADGILAADVESSDDPIGERLAEADEVTFGLERDLQTALRANITQLEPGLKIVDGNREQTTEAGRIDITAADTQGNTVVIELKAGTASQAVVAQILAYMSVVAKSSNTPVRGILVAGDFDKRVVLAARMVPNLQLRRYTFQFSFQQVD